MASKKIQRIEKSIAKTKTAAPKTAKKTKERDFSFMGDEAPKVQEWRGRWDKILKDSVIVNLYIGQWYPHARLTTDRMARLGVKIEDPEVQKALKGAMRSGSIDLVPRPAYYPIAAAGQSARNNLRWWTHEVMWGFCLNRQKFSGWDEQHRKYEAEFRTLADFLASNLRKGENLLGQMTGAYTLIFGDAYDRLQRMGGVEGTRKAFIEDAISDLHASVPEEEQVREHYIFETTYSWAPMADEIAASEQRAIELRLNTASMSATEQQVLEDMQARVASQVERRRQIMEDTFKNAEQGFYMMCMEALKSIGEAAGNGKLTGGNVVRMKSLAQEVSALNVFDDASLNGYIAKINQLVDDRAATSGKKGKEASMDELKAALAEVTGHIQTKLADIPPMRGVRVELVGEEGDEATVDATPANRRGAGEASTDDSAPDDAPTTRRGRGKSNE